MAEIRISKTILSEMLDTVGIKHFYRSLACDDFKTSWKSLLRRRNPTWTFNAKGSETLPKLTMINTPDGIWHLSAEVSLPKMIFGHNARLPNQDEIENGLRKIARYAEDKSGLRFNIPTATVSSIHFAYDVHLSESEVLPMIYKLSDRTMRYTDKLFYNDSTLYFQTKRKTRLVRIYPKLQEILKDRKATVEAIKAATGVLRLEHCLLDSGIINSFVKRNNLPDKTVSSLLNEAVSMMAISEIFDELNFFEMLADDRSNLEILREHFPMRKAINLNGFLEAIRIYGENFYKNDSLGFTKDCYYSDARNCRKAKVWKQRKSLE